MKYLDILKEYDKAIVTESKKLDSIYKKLIGESCDCGKPDCPECNAQKENLEEGCDKGKIEFDEGEEDGGKQDKKMMPPEKFEKMVSKEEPQNNEEPPEMLSREEFLGSGDKNVSENNKNMENEIKEFFGVQDDSKSQESEKNDSNNDGKRSVAEDIEKNVKMSADEIFGGEGGSEGNTESSGDNIEKPVSEKKEEEPKDEPEPPVKDEPEKQKKVDENEGKSIRELMGKQDGISECDPTNGSFHNGH